VNADTVALVNRPYLEIVDDLLTAIVGGVVNEPIEFDVKSDRYQLSRPALALRSITGTLDEKPYIFQQTVDYALADEISVGWLPGGKHPDDNTTFYVDYLVPGSSSPLSDVNVGSVTRTLAEAIGREIATVYGQINAAYLAGFVETATGTSLELVVSILGMHRKTKDFAQGLVTFFRDATSTGAITIPSGTLLVASTEERPQFETTETRTLQPGVARIDVPVRATEEFKGEVGVVAAGTIDALVVVRGGISRVSNLDATFLGAEDESDDELRRRAKTALRAISKGTEAAIRQAVLEERAAVLELWDPNAPEGRRTDPGRVAVLVETEPNRFPSILGAVHEVRAAGVELTLLARYVYLTLRVRGTIPPGLPPAGQDKIVAEVIDALQAYVAGLESGEAADGEKLLAALGEVDDLSEPAIVDVIPRRSDVTRPGLESLVDELAAALTPPPPDEAALRNVLTAVLTAEAPAAPTAARIFDRSLVQGPSGQQATDGEIEAGTFKVTVPADGKTWWIVLDMSASDVALTVANGG
jgi:Baseplate J-like protein